MPRKASPKQPKPVLPVGEFYLPADSAWGGFINLRLNEEHKTQFDRWYGDDAPLVWQLLDDAIGGGMKFSLAYDAENQAYIATFTGKLYPDATSRCATSSRAPVLDEAIALLVWKFFVLAQCDMGDYLVKTSSLHRWG